MKHLYIPLLLLLFASFSFGANDKYRISITDDPATTMTIGWNQISGHSVALFYDVVDHGTDAKSYSDFQLPDRTVFYKGMNNYFVRLTDLAPSTVYYFVIVDNEGTSERFWFKTLPDKPNVPLSIVAGGDSRRSGSEIVPHEPRIESNKIVKAIRPDFVAFGGDYTDDNTDGQWQSWFDDWQHSIGDDGRMTPLYNTRGNHEHSNEDIVNLFDVPYDDVYYAINFGGSLIRFYTLNSMFSIAGEQTEWLSEDLEKNNDATVWKMAQYHYTIAPHISSKPYRVAQYEHWANLFYKHGMQLVIECDTHVARNSWPVRPSEEEGSDGGFIRDDQNGTVYAGEGSWGLIRNVNVNYNWTRDAGSFTQVKWIQANMDSLVVYTIKSATSNPSIPVNDEDRFIMPDDLDIWVMADGSDRVVIDRPNPLYESVLNVLEAETISPKAIIQYLYPNPTQEVLRVEVREAKNHRYQISSMQGKIVSEGTIRETFQDIDLKSLSNGTYFFRLWESDESQYEVRKFIKK